MILQSLVEYYETLAAEGKINRPGWSQVGVSYGLELDGSGSLVNVVPLRQEIPSGKKTVLRPQAMTVPTPVKRSSGIQPNFLCDNSTYFIGSDNKGNPKHARECFLAAKKLHLRFLSGLAFAEAQAVCRFFERWDPDRAEENPALAPVLEDIRKGTNLVFLYCGRFVQDHPEIRAVWQSEYDTKSESGKKMQCLVTGRTAPVARLHPAIRGIRNGKSTGNSLVCFNDLADESYEKTQGLNAPTSKYAAFAYGAALNFLLADRNRVQFIGDATVVCWAEDAEESYQDAFSALLFGQLPETLRDIDLQGILKKLALGRTVNWGTVPLHPENHFYILGLAPNAARLSVRFFLRDTFGDLAEKLQRHYHRLEIVKSSFDHDEAPGLKDLLDETVNQHSKNKSPLPQMAGDTLRAILTDTPYPATLFDGVQLRIRAEHQVTRGRSALIKAYLLKNTAHTAEFENYREVLSVELNEHSTYVPYVLGRLFSVLENIQQQANPGINTTIRDKYFNSACSMPDAIFPVLINLAQKHLKKIKGNGMGIYVNLEKQLSSLMNLITEEYPKHLDLHDQGIFQLGYYHQTQKRYEKKQEGKENV